MSIPKFNPRTTLLLLIICFVAVLRLSTNMTKELSPLVMYSPLGAMALFGGAYFKGNIKPFAFPLLALFISDLVLSFTVFSEFRSGLLYGGWYWVYGSFALMTIAGKLLIKDVNIKSILTATLVTVLIHWLVSDLGAALSQNGFANIMTTYQLRLVTAIPYELRFLSSTIIYSGIMFGSFELLKNRVVAPEAR